MSFLALPKKTVLIRLRRLYKGSDGPLGGKTGADIAMRSAHKDFSLAPVRLESDNWSCGEHHRKELR